MESSFRMGELFDDQESTGEVINSERLREDSDKWSLKGDLNLLCTLENFSQDLSAKSEVMQKDLDQITYDSKMKAVKVKNLINDFQMLENCQFIENRVYDEEIDDAVVNGNMSASDDLAKSDDPEVVKKNIKKSLEAGLHFLDKTLNGYRQVNEVSFDSEEEEDCVYANLAAMLKDNKFNKMPLPHIVGSDLFMRDNFFTSPDVNNESAEASEVETKNEQRDDGEYFSDESSFDQETFAKPIENHIEVSNDDGIFIENNTEEEDDFLFVPKRKPSVISSKTAANDVTVTSDEVSIFDDSVSAVDSKHVNQSNDEIEKATSVSQLKKNLKLENIFANVTSPVNKPTTAESSGEDDDIFSRKVVPAKNQNLEDPKVKSAQSSRKTLFDEDGDDDLFSTQFKPTTSKTVSEPKTMKNKLNFLSDDEDDVFASKPVIKHIADKPKTEVKNLVSDAKPTIKSETKQEAESKEKKEHKSSNNLFADIDNDDLFSETISKKNPVVLQPREETTKSSNVKTTIKQTVKAADTAVKSITNAFAYVSDDSEDDLFGKISSTKPTLKSKNNADELFNDVSEVINSAKKTDSLVSSVSNVASNKNKEIETENRDEDEYESDRSSSGDELFTTASNLEASKDDLFNKDEEELFTPRRKSKLGDNSLYKEEPSSFEEKISISKSDEKSISSSDVSPASSKNAGSNVSALRKALNLEDIFANMGSGAKMSAKKKSQSCTSDDEDDDDDIFAQTTSNQKVIPEPSKGLFVGNSAEDLFSKSSSSVTANTTSNSVNILSTKTLQKTHSFLSDDEDDIFVSKTRNQKEVQSKPVPETKSETGSSITLAGSSLVGNEEEDDLFSVSSKKVKSESIILPPTVTEEKKVSIHCTLNNSMFKDRAKLGALRKKRNPSRKATAFKDVYGNETVEEAISNSNDVNQKEDTTSSAAKKHSLFETDDHNSDSEDDLFGKSSKHSKRKSSLPKNSKQVSLESKPLFSDNDDFDLFNPSSKVSRKNSKLKMFAGDETDDLFSKRNGNVSTHSDPSDDDLFTRK